MEPELDSPPFSTVPATPSIEDVDVAWTRSSRSPLLTGGYSRTSAASTRPT